MARAQIKSETDMLPGMETRAYIDGNWYSGKKTFAVANPADGSHLADVTDCDAADTQTAIVAAQKAFPAWKALLPKQRADCLRKWFELITQQKDELAALMSREQGKPLAEAKGEITYAAAYIEWFSEEARRAYGRTVPPHKDGTRILVTREPIGVCAAITPWNFPSSMITRAAGPALAAGCTFIVKPAAETPLSALALATLAHKAGIPAGVFNVVPSNNAAAIGKVLTENPDVRMLSFTGSTDVGRKLMAQCAPTLKRLCLELGGNAPFIVFDDADLNTAVSGAILSKFRNSGQTCVCANRFYVQRGIYGAFAEALASAVADLKVGAAFENDVAQDVQVGPLINEGALKKVAGLVQDAIEHGAQVKCGGEPHAKGGLFYAPTILTDATQAMRLAREEIFGPVAPLFPFDTEEEAVTLANATEHGLAAYLYTRDVGRAFRMSEALEYGMVGVNEGIVSNVAAPFGGIKQSGFGREGGVEGMEEYTQIKYTLMGGL